MADLQRPLPLGPEGPAHEGAAGEGGARGPRRPPPPPPPGAGAPHPGPGPGRPGPPTDPANAYPAVKALIDGLVDAGVLPDDDAAHLDGPDMRLGDPDPRLPTGHHRLTVNITDTTDDKGRP